MNVLKIMSDRHTAEFAGCYGDDRIRTPNLDALADRGTRYNAAYCLSPTCAPSRASMMSGRYIHEIDTWCNAHPYSGEPDGWGKHFTQQGVHFTTIGKLDFYEDADVGIADCRKPSYRTSPDVTTLYRDQEIARYLFASRYLETGPAETINAFRGDLAVADEAANWLANDRPTDRPWITVVNFKHGHRPWLPNTERWDHHDPLVPTESLDGRFTEPLDALHPFHRGFSVYSGGHLVSLEAMRRAIVGYLGCIEILDSMIGTVLSALEATGELEDTLVIYTSDHGGNLGEHRILDHGGLYDESARIPLIIAGPNVPSEKVVDTPVSALDLYPTANAAQELDQPDHLRGASLIPLASGQKSENQTPALCQFHATGFHSSGFALRDDSHKFIRCVGERSMLFDVENDPLELNDLLAEERVTEESRAIEQQMNEALEEICDPEEADERCKAAQRQKRQELESSGQLFNELDRRGFERTAERLVPRPETIFEPPPDALRP